MVKARQEYSEEYKVAAVRLVMEQGKSQAAACRHLGISSSTICKWVNEHKKSKNPEAVVESGKDAEIHKLKKELCSLKIEQDILKKAAAYFAAKIIA